MKMKFKNGELEVEAMLSDLVKVDFLGDPLEPATDDLSTVPQVLDDPVGSFFKTAAKQAKGGTTSTDFDVRAAILAPGDVRPVVSLHKSASPASSDDWSWSASIGTGVTLEKHATPAKERFDQQLQEFFRGHNDEYWETRELIDKMLEDERAEILAGAV